MKRRTKALIYSDIADAVKCIWKGKEVKRNKNKDGSITTKPIRHLYLSPKLEKEVLKDCLKWLRKNGCVADRMNVGGGRLSPDSGKYYTYGIVGAGDIMGILPNGRHFEIECKAGSGGRWSAAQQKRKIKIERNKGIYLIAHGVEELEWHFKELGIFDEVD